MNIVKTSLIALTIFSATASSAFAYVENRDRDALQGQSAQSGVDVYYSGDQGATVQVVTPSAVDQADREIIRQNKKESK